MRYIRTSIVQVYAPTNDAKAEAKDVFYEQVQNVLDKIPKHDIVILMGDWNVKVGDQQDGEEGVVGHHGLHGVRSESGEHFVELCASSNMVITTTLFPHKDIHKHTWVSPDTCTKNQIIVCGKFRRSVLDTRDFRGANVNSDHHLVITKIKLQLCRVEKNTNRLNKYKTAKLKLPEVAQSFKIELRNRFSCLADDEANNRDDRAQDVENDWKKIKQTYQKKQLKRFWGFSQDQTNNGSVLKAGRKWMTGES